MNGASTRATAAFSLGCVGLILGIAAAWIRGWSHGSGVDLGMWLDFAVCVFPAVGLAIVVLYNPVTGEAYDRGCKFGQDAMLEAADSAIEKCSREQTRERWQDSLEGSEGYFETTFHCRGVVTIAVATAQPQEVEFDSSSFSAKTPYVRITAQDGDGKPLRDAHASSTERPN